MDETARPVGRTDRSTTLRPSCFPSLPLLVLLLGAPGPAGAQQNPLEIPVPRTDVRPVLDGVLDEATWRGAAVLDRWVQTKPGDNIRPAGKTVAYLAYDSENLYLAIEATDEPGQLRVRRHARDVVSRQAQDWISIQLDTYNDRRRAFGLAVNPLGLQGDGIQVEGSSTFEDWNGIWHAAGKALGGGDGFTVEIAVPFKSLRYPNRAEQRWGIALRRTYGRATMEDRPWPYSRDLACDFCQMATLTGIRDIEASRNIELSPTMVTRGQQDRPTPASRLDRFEARAELGGNLKVGLTPNLTFDGTYNPDFSQVESDAGQLEINNRFALFFREQRPFFLEGTDIFLTAIQPPGDSRAPINVVHTRQILDPRGGLKLSGKAGRLGIGLVGALDDARPYTLPGTLGGIRRADLDPLAGDRTRFLIGRAKLDVLQDGFLGLVATHRQLGDGYAYTAGGDFRVRLGPNWSLRGLYTHSASRETDAAGPIEEALRGRLAAGAELAAALDSIPDEVRPFDGIARRGDALQTQVEYGSRSWNAGVGYLDLTPQYRTEVGFTPRTDYAAFFGWLQYVHQGTGFFQRIAPQASYDYGFRHGRNRLFSLADHTDLVATFALELQLPQANNLVFGYTRKFFQVGGIDFSGLNSFWAFGSSQTAPWLSLSFAAERERGVIFTDLVEGGDPKPATEVSGTLTATFRPAAPVVLETELRTSRIWRRTDAESQASRYAESLIPRTRFLLQFTKAFGFRGITEYRIERFYDREGALARKRDQFMYDLLFTFLVQPQQSLHLGWTQLAQAELGRPMQAFQRGGLLKASYLWRF